MVSKTIACGLAYPRLVSVWLHALRRSVCSTRTTALRWLSPEGWFRRGCFLLRRSARSTRPASSSAEAWKPGFVAAAPASLPAGSTHPPTASSAGEAGSGFVVAARAAAVGTGKTSGGASSSRRHNRCLTTR